MIVYNEKLEEMLKKEFGDEATPEFLNLVKGGIATHEHAFNEYEITKEKYLEFISDAWDKEKLKEEFGDKATPESLNLIRVAIATHEHASNKYGITKEKYLEWISNAWDTGKHQREIYNMEIEGCINNWLGVSIGFGGTLSLFGEREGYIIKSKK